MTRELFGRFLYDVSLNNQLQGKLLDDDEMWIRGYTHMAHTLTEDELTELFKAMKSANQIRRQYEHTPKALKKYEVLGTIARIASFELGYNEE